MSRPRPDRVAHAGGGAALEVVAGPTGGGRRRDSAAPRPANPHSHDGYHSWGATYAVFPNLEPSSPVPPGARVESLVDVYVSDSSLGQHAALMAPGEAFQHRPVVLGGHPGRLGGFLAWHAPREPGPAESFPAAPGWSHTSAPVWRVKELT